MTHMVNCLLYDPEAVGSIRDFLTTLRTCLPSTTASKVAQLKPRPRHHTDAGIYLRLPKKHEHSFAERKSTQRQAASSGSFFWQSCLCWIHFLGKAVLVFLGKAQVYACISVGTDPSLFATEPADTTLYANIKQLMAETKAQPEKFALCPPQSDYRILMSASISNSLRWRRSIVFGAIAKQPGIQELQTELQMLAGTRASFHDQQYEGGYKLGIQSFFCVLCPELRLAKAPHALVSLSTFN